MEVFNPTGASAVNVPHAPRLNTLRGKKVALMSNEQWQSHRMLPLLEKALGAEFPLSTFETIHAGMAIRQDEAIEALAAGGYDAVIVGNAA